MEYTLTIQEDKRTNNMFLTKFKVHCNVSITNPVSTIFNMLVP